MSYRSAMIVAVLLAALAPANGEATTRMSFSIAKSFHPESDRNYSTVHPGFGATGRLAGRVATLACGLGAALALASGALRWSCRHVAGARELATGTQCGARWKLSPRALGAPRSGAHRAVEGPGPQPCLGVRIRASRAGDVCRIERADPILGLGCHDWRLELFVGLHMSLPADGYQRESSPGAPRRTGATRALALERLKSSTHASGAGFTLDPGPPTIVRRRDETGEFLRSVAHANTCAVARGVLRDSVTPPTGCILRRCSRRLLLSPLPPAMRLRRRGCRRGLRTRRFLSCFAGRSDG